MLVFDALREVPTFVRHERSAYGLPGPFKGSEKR
jgi:hypothetical protein